MQVTCGRYLDYRMVAVGEPRSKDNATHDTGEPDTHPFSLWGATMQRLMLPTASHDLPQGHDRLQAH